MAMEKQINVCERGKWVMRLRAKLEASKHKDSWIV